MPADDDRGGGRTTRDGDIAEIYRGIGGFYLVNRKGQLGYVRQGDGVPVRETFQRPRVPSAAESDTPSFEQHVASFERAVTYLLQLYLTTPLWRSMELGYVLPAGAGGHRWSSASLIAHHEVVARFRAHEEAQIRAGVLDPFKQAETSESLRAERSIHHGMDDLLHLSDELGRYVYMPMLYFRGTEKPPLPQSAATTGDVPPPEVVVPASAGFDEPLRVVNLIWRPLRSQFVLPDGSRVDETRLLDPANPVLDLLRTNLIGRGAIDRAKRVENRFSIM